ncbi:gas vesicle protein [Streptomyces sp. LBUM 1478]|uniref:Putative gas vesicle synthesis protein n=2 Tax=Streptomyces TaxID=1883 RepID=C9YZ61_STRSW|nr:MULTISPECIES: gas vesicle protein [Streptomyces]MBP5861921.1 gas vesicle protein [Streptomyces sp. LBUM 1484]MBP5869133.1 gas vesicle protein [Streptomyces sp. LBUM 1485]MBP5907612.1 gas vesicle protein [Streptomyces sp. LBUM 1478]MBP5929478.1 gas vesicle protein [Streptomyces sp. LBUM 1479]KFG10425.1 gas vesicle protein [Streptomyces scabiei]
MMNGRESEKRRSSSRQSESAEDRVSAPEAMRNAIEQLAELLGRAPESVSALKPTEEGWEAQVEVLELERVPQTTSVMAAYRVALDPAGKLLAYERGRRYTRAQVDRGSR